MENLYAEARHLNGLKIMLNWSDKKICHKMTVQAGFKQTGLFVVVSFRSVIIYLVKTSLFLSLGKYKFESFSVFL